MTAKGRDLKKVRLRGVRRVMIDGDYIKLDALLKFASVAATGGEAKMLVQGGDVLIGGVVCVSRGRKVRQGEIVRCGENVLVVKRKNVR